MVRESAPLEEPIVIVASFFFTSILFIFAPKVDLPCRVRALVAMLVSGFMPIALVSHQWPHRRRRAAESCIDCKDDRHVDMSNRVCVQRIVERKCKWRER